MQDEELEVYNIPLNYRNAGTYRGIPIPNAIEGAIVAIIFEFFFMRISFTFQFRMVAFFVTSIGIMVLFIRGINGDRISIFFISFLKFLFKKITRECKYHMRKVGVKDVETFKNRNTDSGTSENNFKKYLSSFKKRNAGKN